MASLRCLICLSEEFGSAEQMLLSVRLRRWSGTETTHVTVEPHRFLENHLGSYLRRWHNDLLCHSPGLQSAATNVVKMHQKQYSWCFPELTLKFQKTIIFTPREESFIFIIWVSGWMTSFLLAATMINYKLRMRLGIYYCLINTRFKLLQGRKVLSRLQWSQGQNINQCCLICLVPS